MRTLDSNLERGFKHPGTRQVPPPNMPTSFHLEIKTSGEWQPFHHVVDNTQRQITVPVKRAAEGMRLRIEAIREASTSHVYGLYFS